jgi:hypothetical protein
MAPPGATRPSLASLASIAFVVALAAALSCTTFDPPNETCDPRRLDAKRALGEAADGTCSRCLEDRCCDRVGSCERKGGCPEIVSSVHACVLEQPLAGARREQGCANAAGLAQDPEANDAYRCMRDACGRECGLPVCKVDPAAVLIQNATCDGCFAGSCCEQLNGCYGSRACKLMIECITRSCGTQLGQALASDATRPPHAAEASAGDVCGAATGAPPADFTAPDCVRACLCKFRDNDQGLLPEDPERRPFTLALRVYECGANAGCGSSCVDGPDDASAP